jgi:hypothetical protein
LSNRIRHAARFKGQKLGIFQGVNEHHPKFRLSET